jgi:sensor histidine kinase YesM
VNGLSIGPLYAYLADPMSAGASHRPRRRAILAASIIALVIAALIPVYRLQHLSWLQAVAAAFFFVAPCVLLGWAVWRLLTRKRRARPVALALGMHVLTALAFSGAWTLAFTGLGYLVSNLITMEFLRDGAVWQFVWGLVIYGALVQAARAQENLRARELAAAGAELQALRAQLDPHFLFNTLHSLTQLAREDPVATQDALERFGELMRYVLRSGRDATADVSLEEELDFVRDYLALEKLRLGDRLRVIEDIDADALELSLPPLLLQPLVENAVRHGLAPRREGGTIRLKAQLAKDMLAIEIADDGGGAEPEAWRRAAGLGLKAVDRQLQTRFPRRGELAITTGPQAGFSARLRFPARPLKRAP